MGQEAEKEINFEGLKAIVDNATKNKDTSTIEAIEGDKQLRYLQKYTELRISKGESSISSSSLFAGVIGLGVGVFAIGVSVFLTGASIVPKEVFTISGIIMMGLGIWAILKIKKAYKEFEKIERDIEFMHVIILKTEEKLSSKTQLPALQPHETKPQPSQ